jgi:hypothetical protein
MAERNEDVMSKMQVVLDVSRYDVREDEGERTQLTWRICGLSMGAAVQDYRRRPEAVRDIGPHK